MALAFLELQTELYARGFAYLNDGGAGVTRAKRWINEAMHDIDDMERWDYLRATSTGAAPLTIADLGEVDTVHDASLMYPLGETTRDWLVETWGELTTAGVPLYWYRTTPTTIAVYPVSTVTLTVGYFKFGPDLSANGDAPLMPDRYRQAIVEMAAAKAHRDNTNEQQAREAQAEAERIVNTMRSKLVSWPTSILAAR